MALNASTVVSDAGQNVVRDGSQAVQNNWFIVGGADAVTKKANETKTVV